MTVILFIVDTSASMAQKNYKGSSTLDVCKSIISDFVKIRGRDVGARGFDRYMLMTTEQYPTCIKELRTTWRDTVLSEQMKPLRARGRNSLSKAMMNAFRLLNINRGSTGIDNFGFGRYPYFMEPVFIFTLSDGLAVDDITKDFKLEFNQRGDMAKEAFRWDQRMFSLVFRLPSLHPKFVPGSRIEPDVDVIERLCTATGGRSFAVSCHKQISQCVEQMIGSMQTQGIAVRFQCPALKSRINGENSSSNDLPPEARLQKRLEARPLTTILIRMVGGKPVNNHWPIPEAFWHTRLDNGLLPPRSAHPTIIFALEACSSMILPDLPFDKYELEPSPVVDYVLERLKEGGADQCLHVFIHNSGRVEGYGKPFGYLKVASSGTSVNLFLMPYNYPVLIQLLQELRDDQGLKGNSTWRRRLDNYLDNVPTYYLTALRKTLGRFRLNGGLLDEQNAQPPYPSTILNMLNRLRSQMKEELDRTCATVNTAAQQQQAAVVAPEVQMVVRRDKLDTRTHWRSEVESSLNKAKLSKKGKDPRGGNKEEEPVFRDPEEELNEAGTDKTTNLQIHIGEPRIRSVAGSTYRNPLVLRKEEVIEQIPRMRANIHMLLRDSAVALLEGGRPGFHIKLHHAEELHSQPISGMGNYEEYSKAMQAIGRGPLREVEPKAVRSHAFGNPFKTDKKSLAIDEVGESPAVENSSAKESRRERRVSALTPNRPPKRKPGPLGLNSLGQWRERRQSISERSSVMSEAPSLADFDESMPSSSQSPSHGIVQNGTMVSSTNGTATPTQHITNALSDVDLSSLCGLEEEHEDSEDNEEPPMKRGRLDGDPSIVPPVVRDLGSEELHRRKLLLAALIRNSRGPGALKQVQDVIGQCSVQDELELFEFCVRDSRRFKRKSLTDDLNGEVVRLRKKLIVQL